jgi:hypothetical protein
MGHTSLMQILKIITFLMKILGFFPYKITSNYNIIYSWSKNILSIFLLLVIFLSVFFSLFLVKESNTVDLTPFMIINVVYLSALMVTAILTILNNKFHTTIFLKLLNQMITVDNKVTKYKLIVNYRKIYTRFLISMNLELFFTLIYSILYSQTKFYSLNLTAFEKLISILHLIFFNLTTMSTSTLYFFVHAFIKGVLATINEKLRSCETNYLIKTVRELSKIRENLWEISKLSNTALGFPLLLLVTLFFIMFTMNTFFVVVNMIEGNFDLYVIISAMWTIFCGIKFISLALRASDCKREAGRSEVQNAFKFIF